MAEYAARMEFTRQGYRVYTPDVDDAGSISSSTAKIAAIFAYR
jgi:hypothetical protein